MPDFLSYGGPKAISVKHDWNKDIDRLYQNYELQERARKEKEQKTAYYAQQMKRGTATAPVNQDRLEKFYDELNSKVADFVVKNPNFETNIDQARELQGLFDQYINNDIIREDQEVQKEYESFKQAYNSGDLTGDEFFQIGQEYDNYINGKSKVKFQYVKPFRKDPNEIIRGISSTVKSGTFSRELTDGRIHNVTENELTKSEASRDSFALYVLETDPEAKFVFERAYNNSAELQNAFKGGVHKYLSYRLKQGLESEDVFSASGKRGSGDGVTSIEQTRFYSNLGYQMQQYARDPENLKKQIILSESDQGAIYLTEKGKDQYITPPPAGAKYHRMNDNGVLEEFTLNRPAMQRSSGKIISIGGIAMVETIVDIPISTSKGTSPTGQKIERRITGSGIELTQEEYLRSTLGATADKNSEKYKKALSDFNNLPKGTPVDELTPEIEYYSKLGFKPKNRYEEGPIPNFGTIVGSAIVLTGSIYQPAVINPSTMSNYENSYVGEATMKETYPLMNEPTLMGSYTNNPFVISPMINNKPGSPDKNAIWRPSQVDPENYFISEDMKYLYNKKTGQFSVNPNNR